MRTIFCIDLDAFFVSVERLLRPDLCGRPVVVGGTGARGVVAAASYEARKFGVRSAMSAGEARKRLRGVAGAIFIPPSHGVYEIHSARVRRLLDEELPEVEAASIDEFYGEATDLAPRAGGPVALAERIAGRIFRECGLPASIGIATSKLVAKIATDEAKPRGLLEVLPGREAAFLAGLPVERIPGVGPKTAPRLHALGFREIGELAAAPAGAVPEWLREAARGVDPARVCERPAARSIGHEETFDRDLSTRADLEAVATDQAERVAARLREDGLAARTIQVKLRYAARRRPYGEGALARETFETITRAVTGPATADGLEIAARARALIAAHWREGEAVRLLGLSARNLGPLERQAQLFDGAGGGADPELRRDRLNRALDDVRARFGFGALRRGTQWLRGEGGPRGSSLP
jgi:DNA polymerase-4